MKFLPCRVLFWTKVVASRLVCGTAILLNTPVRAEMSTGTVMFMHVLAVAELASKANAATERAYIFAGLRYQIFVQGWKMVM